MSYSWSAISLWVHLCSQRHSVPWMIRYCSCKTREGRLLPLLHCCDKNCPCLIESSLPEGDTVKLNKAQKSLIRLTRNVKSGLELTRGRGEQQYSWFKSNNWQNSSAPSMCESMNRNQSIYGWWGFCDVDLTDKNLKKYELSVTCFPSPHQYIYHSEMTGLTFFPDTRVTSVINQMKWTCSSAI